MHNHVLAKLLWTSACLETAWLRCDEHIKIECLSQCSQKSPISTALPTSPSSISNTQSSGALFGDHYPSIFLSKMGSGWGQTGRPQGHFYSLTCSGGGVCVWGGDMCVTNTVSPAWHLQGQLQLVSPAWERRRPLSAECIFFFLWVLVSFQSLGSPSISPPPRIGGRYFIIHLYLYFQDLWARIDWFMIKKKKTRCLCF